MTAEINTISPQFILITYDIDADEITLRGHLLRKLRENHFVMWTQSVYYGRFSQDLYNEIIRIAQRNDQITLTITTPAFPADQSEMLRQQYETKFVEQFVEVEEKMKLIEKMLADEVLREDKEGGEAKPFTALQIRTRINSVSTLLRELESALAHRKERELDASEELLKSFEDLDFRIRSMDAFLDKLRKSNEARFKREEAGA